MTPSVLEHKTFQNGDQFAHIEHADGSRVWRFMSPEFVFQEFKDSSFECMDEFIIQMEYLREHIRIDDCDICPGLFEDKPFLPEALFEI